MECFDLLTKAKQTPGVDGNCMDMHVTIGEAETVQNVWQDRIRVEHTTATAKRVSKVEQERS